MYCFHFIFAVYSRMTPPTNSRPSSVSGTYYHSNHQVHGVCSFDAFFKEKVKFRSNCHLLLLCLNRCRFHRKLAGCRMPHRLVFINLKCRHPIHRNRINRIHWTQARHQIHRYKFDRLKPSKITKPINVKTNTLTYRLPLLPITFN